MKVKNAKYVNRISKLFEENIRLYEEKDERIGGDDRAAVYFAPPVAAVLYGRKGFEQ